MHLQMQEMLGPEFCMTAGVNLGLGEGSGVVRKVRVHLARPFQRSGFLWLCSRAGLRSAGDGDQALRGPGVSAVGVREQAG